MSASAPAEAGIADLLSGDAAEAERARVHPSEHIDHDRLSAAEEGALEVSEHLERKSRDAAKPAATKKATSGGTRSRTATRKASTRKASTRKSTAKKAAAKKSTSRRPPTASAARTTAAASTDPRVIAVGILKRHGGEMPVAKLAEAVVKTGRTKLGGKTPEATVAAQIYVAARKGELFRKVSRGIVALLEPVKS